MDHILRLRVRRRAVSTWSSPSSVLYIIAYKDLDILAEKPTTYKNMILTVNTENQWLLTIMQITHNFNSYAVTLVLLRHSLSLSLVLSNCYLYTFTSRKYPSSGRSFLGPAGLCLLYLSPVLSVRGFISIHQVAPNDLDLDLD